uniref:Transposase n=1 Tax=Heterorhabditis bacteriophora TaxID=37862 RepID=A0A1I7WSC1_HETBA
MDEGATQVFSGKSISYINQVTINKEYGIAAYCEQLRKWVLLYYHQVTIDYDHIIMK